MKRSALVLAMAVLSGCAAPTWEDAREARGDGDFDQAAEIYQSLAEEGDRDAEVALYRLYTKAGVGFDSDEEARAALDRLADEHRHPEALYLKARALKDERDLEEALRYMRRSRDAGHDEAVDYMDTHGELLSRKVSMDRSSADRQKAFADDIYNGFNNLEKDPATAAIWYRKAAERDHPGAQSMLGYLYLQGEGVEQNDGEAYQWYREAAMNDHAAAQGNLGYLYGEGRGVERDPIKAYAWSVLAAENGYEPAEGNKSIYLDQLSNRERLEALDEMRRLEQIIQRNL